MTDGNGDGTGNGRSGRRVGSPDTRAEILRAAREMFAHRGYDRTSVRAVAGAAGVDPALVHHYFGTKEKLLLAVLDAPVDPTAFVPHLVGEGPDGMGERIVATFLAVWDSPAGGPMIGMLRSAVADDGMAGLLKDVMVAQVLVPALTAAGVPKPEIPLRAGMLATQLSGLALMRYVLRLDAVVAASAEEVVAAVGPTLQRYISGELSRPAG